MVKVGVLALQGGVIEHINMLNKISGVEAVEVKKAEQLAHIHGLIIPGGESTTIGKLMAKFNLKEPVIQYAKNGMPIWGTCAGMILLAKHIVNQDWSYLNLMDIYVRRNAYGSQLDSFISYQLIPKVSSEKLPLVFIRAPYIEKAEGDVEVLAELNGKIIAAEQKNLLATSFHPELTDNLSFHRYFVDKIIHNDTVKTG
ncbi:MAG: pyridoxal 5-phosphate synthase pdxT subunit [Thermosediminibacterales bacterium]|nr:pyridoxal 5-phosphate synthase pdxT subunit [Thermosediminibacterales bacterium]MDK2835793.1 pyridoxal 5-phosphate synthase pdxT subunit [Thermosediminibacterales bacterium]